MAFSEIAQFLPGRRRGPSRFLVFVLIGALTFLTLCLFASRLPVLQQLTNARPVGGGSVGQPWMTSLRADAPHHHQAPSEVQVLYDLIEKERANTLAIATMEYGTNKHPPFKDDPPLLVADLPREHIPSCNSPSPTGGGQSKRHGKRLIIVGDVHGQPSVLKALLRKIGFDNQHGDHLIFVGDMVTKGPDSKGVVKLAMDLGASAVRGNQEDKVLAAAREIRRLSVDDDSRLGPAADDEEDGEEEGEDNGNDNQADAETRRKDHVRRIARSLTRAQLAWLRSLPIILRIGHIPGATAPPWNAHTIAIVHGGLVPGVRLEKQDPWAVMNMRSLVYPGKGNKKNKNKKGKPKGKHHPKSASEDDDDDNDDNDNNTDEDKETNDTTPQTPELTLTGEATAVPVDSRVGEPWSHAWNRHQNNLPPDSPHTLTIYGHDAKAGLQVTPNVDVSPWSSSSSSSSSSSNNNNNKKKKKKPTKEKETGLRYAFGLDSGCGHGRQLTALVIEARSDPDGGGVRHWVEQVDCEGFGLNQEGSGPGGDGPGSDGQGGNQRVVGD